MFLNHQPTDMLDPFIWVSEEHIKLNKSTVEVSIFFVLISQFLLPYPLFTLSFNGTTIHVKSEIWIEAWLLFLLQPPTPTVLIHSVKKSCLFYFIDTFLILSFFFFFYYHCLSSYPYRLFPDPFYSLITSLFFFNLQHLLNPFSNYSLRDAFKVQIGPHHGPA